MKLFLYALKRIALLPFQLLLISIATFIMVRALPGDPARLELGPLASEESVARLRVSLRLDQSLLEQYLAYLHRLFQGDLGRSWVNGSEVLDDLVVRLPATLELMAFGMAIVIFVIIPLALLSALPGKSVAASVSKKIGRGYGMLAGALPDFWLGLMLIFVFFSTLGWLPGPEGRLGMMDTPPPAVTGFLTIDALAARDFPVFWSALTHLLLPAVTLAFVYGAPIFKIARLNFVQAITSPYSVYARALGLRDGTVFRLAFRNAIRPILVMIGVIVGYLLGGAVLIETVFNLNGIGQYVVQAISTADYAPVQMFVLIAAVFTKLTYLLVDLAYFATDPTVMADSK
ncbi:ABC transporter permease (plasmid) [Aminobacter sp. SR38]|jgi:peptide/nickel transport system permease protein|uniref:ABC transporter permease n=1 Tax=Aminobacter sp. SR38 TaxID=2774562 RepID=UPI00177AFCE3|nr:ABC transporter permease [Aminobacter sp. SR38]QOF75505.1 ABC transporter permease [Aminobacter sp. SR38]